ncbi:MAG: aspartyl protease family protein [Hyphomonadaceae bacterium]|nr:aspartyl protease family protein [Hyphomonadaceae bacterium]
MSLLSPTRRMLLAAAPALAVAGNAYAQQAVTGLLLKPDDDPSADAEMPLDAWTDTFGRPTAKVRLNGKGPFRFLVDTGSTTTVLAARLSEVVGAPMIGTAIVNGTTGTAEMPIATMATLETGVVTKTNVRVAIISDRGLAREDGILGADVFAGRRLNFDIQNKTVTVDSSKRQSRFAPVSNLRVRNGLLAEIDGRIGTIPVKLMLDTGAQHCIGNMPLQRALERAYPRQRRVDSVKVVGVTGHTIIGNFFELPKVDFRKFAVKDAGAVMADAPIFQVWNLDRDPALIVGVNLLARLAGFSIDYGARTFDAQLMAMGIARNTLMLG